MPASCNSCRPIRNSLQSCHLLSVDKEPFNGQLLSSTTSCKFHSHRGDTKYAKSSSSLLQRSGSTWLIDFSATILEMICSFCKRSLFILLTATGLPFNAPTYIWAPSLPFAILHFLLYINSESIRFCPSVFCKHAISSTHLPFCNREGKTVTLSYYFVKLRWSINTTNWGKLSRF